MACSNHPTRDDVRKMILSLPSHVETKYHYRGNLNPDANTIPGFSTYTWAPKNPNRNDFGKVMQDNSKTEIHVHYFNGQVLITKYENGKPTEAFNLTTGKEVKRK